MRKALQVVAVVLIAAVSGCGLDEKPVGAPGDLPFWPSETSFGDECDVFLEPSMVSLDLLVNSCGLADDGFKDEVAPFQVELGIGGMHCGEGIGCTHSVFATYELRQVDSTSFAIRLASVVYRDTTQATFVTDTFELRFIEELAGAAFFGYTGGCEGTPSSPEDCWDQRIAGTRGGRPTFTMSSSSASTTLRTTHLPMPRGLSGFTSLACFPT